MSKKRSKAREFAVQAVYQWQMSGNELADILRQFSEEKKPKTYETEYFQEKVGTFDLSVSTIIEAQPLLNEMLEKVRTRSKNFIR